jgi:hypothetical protein
MPTKRVILEHHGDVGRLRSDVVDEVAVDTNLARSDLFQILLSKVGLPQPDGPTRMTNSPEAISIETL